MTAQGYEFYLRVLVGVFPSIILPRVLRGCFRGNEAWADHPSTLWDCLFLFSAWEFRSQKCSKTKAGFTLRWRNLKTQLYFRPTLRLVVPPTILTMLRLVSIWSQTIADRGSQIAKCSAIVCDHMETHFCDRLRSSAINCDRAIIRKPKFCDLRSKLIR